MFGADDMLAWGAGMAGIASEAGGKPNVADGGLLLIGNVGSKPGD